MLLRAQLAGVPIDKIKTTLNSTGGVDLLDTNQSKDIYVLYGPYMVKAAKAVEEQLIKLGQEVE